MAKDSFHDFEVRINDSSGLVISRPEHQEGLCERIPKGEVPAGYLNEYRADFMVRCAFCDAQRWHNRGFTAVMEDGRIALCGHDCAEQFGLTAQVLSGQLERRKRAVSMRRKLRVETGNLSAVVDLLTDEVMQMEDLAMHAVKAINASGKGTNIHHRPGIRGLAALRNSQAAAYPRRLRMVRRKLAEWLDMGDLSAQPDEVVLTILKERDKLVALIKDGCLFLDAAADLFTAESIRAISDYFRNNAAADGTYTLTSPLTGGIGLKFYPTGPHPTGSARYELVEFHKRPAVDDILAALSGRQDSS